jgi:hypothetical protein
MDSAHGYINCIYHILAISGGPLCITAELIEMVLPSSASVPLIDVPELIFSLFHCFVPSLVEQSCLSICESGTTQGSDGMSE